MRRALLVLAFFFVGCDDLGTRHTTSVADDETSSGSEATSDDAVAHADGTDHTAATASEPLTWDPLTHCQGIDRAAGVGTDASTARVTHIVNALVESASCWLTDDELTAVEAHRQTLPTTAPIVPAAYATADQAARVLAPLALEAAGRRDDAARLRALAPIVDEASRAAAEASLRALTPEALRRGALPPPGQLMFAPTISLDDGHGCTMAHVPASLHVTPADAAVATAAMASINLAVRSPQTADITVDGRPAGPVTVAFGPATMFIGGAQGASVTACFALSAGAPRERVTSALSQALDAIAAAHAG